MTNLIIKNTKKYGRGLYATRNFKKGEIIETSPILLIEKTDIGSIETTVLNTYVFEWTKNASALALGHGSLFNHSPKSNVAYMNSFRTKEIFFITTKNIKKGQQLFIDYGYDPLHGIKITEQNRAHRREQDKYHKLNMFKEPLMFGTEKYDAKQKTESDEMPSNELISSNLQSI